MAVCETCGMGYDSEKQSWNCPHENFPPPASDRMENHTWRWKAVEEARKAVEEARKVLYENLTHPCKPFFPPGNPAVLKFLDNVLPGKRVVSFSLHFDQDSAYLNAEMILEEGEVEEFLMQLSEKVIVEKSNAEIAKEVESSVSSDTTRVKKDQWNKEQWEKFFASLKQRKQQGEKQADEG